MCRCSRERLPYQLIMKVIGSRILSWNDPPVKLGPANETGVYHRSPLFRPDPLFIQPFIAPLCCPRNRSSEPRWCFLGRSRSQAHVQNSGSDGTVAGCSYPFVRPLSRDPTKVPRSSNAEIEFEFQIEDLLLQRLALSDLLLWLFNIHRNNRRAILKFLMYFVFAFYFYWKCSFKVVRARTWWLDTVGF